jgi:hypothetical protein
MGQRSEGVITDGSPTQGSHWRDNAALISAHGFVHAARPVVTGGLTWPSVSKLGFSGLAAFL